MSERKSGWYWVKPTKHCGWQCAYYDDLAKEIWAVVYGALDVKRVYEFGPRIPTPDEPWQCVPIVPTREMMESTGDTSAEAYSGMLGAWMMMLSAAPQPENS